MEECIAEANRYYPCPPPKLNLEEFDDLLEKRKNQFLVILKSYGYNVSEETQNFIKDENYEKYVEDFLNSKNKNENNEKLPEYHENFIKHFVALRKKFTNTFSENFTDYQKALKDAVCMREISNTVDLFTNFNEIADLIKNDSNSQEFEEFRVSAKTFFQQFPKEVQEKCDNEEKQQEIVKDKLKVIRKLKWNCKYDFFLE